MYHYRIMQMQETGEEVHAPCQDFEFLWEAEDWIDENQDQYEESSFWIEKISPMFPYTEE